MNTLKYFIWGYQQHFQISVKVAADGLFTKLDADFKPIAFLVGVLLEEREDRYQYVWNRRTAITTHLYFQMSSSNHFILRQ